MESVIDSISNVTAKGVMIHLKKECCLDENSIECKDFWVSWDKIGKSLFTEVKEK